MYYKKPVFAIEVRTISGKWEVIKKEIDVGFGQKVCSPVIYPSYQDAEYARSQMGFPVTKLRVVRIKYFDKDDEDENDEDIEDEE